MNFKEACELSKKHPGSLVRRTDAGNFAVLDCDGASIDPSREPDLDPFKSASRHSQEAANQKLQEKLEATQSELLHFRNAYERATQEVSYQVSQAHSLAERLREHKEQYDRLHKQYNELNRTHKAYTEENSQLKTKIDSISDSEWKLINARHKKEKEEYAKEMREKRVTMRCPCSGEAENCVRCYGAGEYIVDGNGNPV